MSVNIPLNSSDVCLLVTSLQNNAFTLCGLLKGSNVQQNHHCLFIGSGCTIVINRFYHQISRLPVAIIVSNFHCNQPFFSNIAKIFVLYIGSRLVKCIRYQIIVRLYSHNGHKF